MNIVTKATAGILICVVLYLVLSKNDKDISIILSMLVCCIIFTASFAFIQPILSFLSRLSTIGNFDKGYYSIILKATGIGLLSEITNWICTDAGCTSIGRVFQILTSAAIIWLSLPVFESMLTLIDNILGAI